MVVTSGRSLLAVPDEAGTRASVMIDPLLPTRTLATGDVVVTDEPAESVVTTRIAGKRADVVTVSPREFVVVNVWSTLTDADS